MAIHRWLHHRKRLLLPDRRHADRLLSGGIVSFLTHEVPVGYSDATPLPWAPGFYRGVKPRWERTHATLWIGLPIHFVRYDPPQSSLTFGRAGELRTVVRWNDDAEWSNFKRTFISAINDFWHHRFILVPAGRAARGRPQEVPGAIICGFQAWEEPNHEWARMRAVVFKPPAATQAVHYISECRFFGQASLPGLPSGCPDWITAVLDKNDLEPMEFVSTLYSYGQVETLATLLSTTQRGCVHEVGHHLGLMHRCTEVRVRQVPTSRPFGVGTHDHTGAYVRHDAAATSSSSGDGYCADSNNRVAIRDLMARGEVCHYWHASPWHHILMAGRGQGGGDRTLQLIADVSWMPMVARQNGDAEDYAASGISPPA